MPQGQNREWTCPSTAVCMLQEERIVDNAREYEDDGQSTQAPAEVESVYAGTTI